MFENDITAVAIIERVAAELRDLIIVIIDPSQK